MRFHGWWCVPVILTATLSVGIHERAAAQSTWPPPSARQTGGWQPTSQSTNGSRDVPSTELASRKPAPATGVVQTAYFQAQGSLSDGLPAFPAGGGSVTPPVQPPPYIAPPQLPMATPNYGPATDRASLPAASLPAASLPAQLASGELRSVQNDRLNTQHGTGPQGPARQVQPPQQVTAAQPNSRLPAAAGARLDAQNITTGYPFVTPAPRGRYPTAPYQPAVFQTAYQAPTIPAQFASTSAYVPQAMPPAAVVPPQQYLTQQQSTLPQFQYPQPGVYPTAYQCTAPAPGFPSTGAVPGAYIPPTLPPNLTPNLYTPNNSGYTPLFSLGQENYNVQLGRGVIGQPTVYVAGQPIRNFMRYLSP